MSWTSWPKLFHILLKDLPRVTLQGRLLHMLLYADLSGSPPVGFPDLNLRTKHLACLADVSNTVFMVFYK